MIKIQFDHQIFSMQRFGGISRYFAGIQHTINQNETFSFRDGILYTTNHYLQGNTYPLPSWVGKLFLKKDKTRSKWNKRYSKLQINNNEFDLFHPTYYHPYFLKKLKKPFILTVHDMIHEVLPEYFPHYDDTMHLKRVLIEKADHFIAISQSTCNDLQKLYGVPDHKISVIHHGLYPGKPDVDYIPTFTHYILFVGERGGYKNFFKMLIAIAPILVQNNINLICAGGSPFSRAELESMLRLKIVHLVQQAAVTDGQLNQLYQKALLFVYPSLYEGFGFPMLEAFNNNCPVAVSDTSCFKEVGGEAVAYFNPYEPESIAEAINSIILSPERSDAFRQKGTVQLQLFPLQLSMQKTLDVYRYITNK